LFFPGTALLEGENLVEVILKWAPERLPSIEALQEARPTVLVIGINIWVGRDDFWNLDVARSMTAFIEGLESLQKVVWLTTAELQVGGQEFAERNDAMRQWAATYASDVEVFILGIDKLAKLSPFQRNDGGDAHYQCAFLDAYPNFVRKDYIKYPKTNDRRDEFNLNVVQLIMGLI